MFALKENGKSVSMLKSAHSMPWNTHRQCIPLADDLVEESLNRNKHIYMLLIQGKTFTCECRNHSSIREALGTWVVGDVIMDLACGSPGMCLTWHVAHLA